MEKIIFMRSLWRFWQKSEIYNDSNFVYIDTPSTVLGLIPTGNVGETKIPVNMIQNVGTKLHMNVVSAAILVLFAPFIIFTAVYGFKYLGSADVLSFIEYMLYVIVYVLFALVSLKRDLVIIHGVAVTKISFSVVESAKARQAADGIVNLQGGIYE